MEQVKTDGLGVGLRFAVTVGNGRQIEMTAGVPLDWKAKDFNELLDKLAAVMDRQALRYEVHDRKSQIESIEVQLGTQREQMANYEMSCREAFVGGNRNGEFRMTGSQREKFVNFQTTERALIAALEKKRKELVEVEEICR
jgi:hypothetical protein